MLSTWLVQVKVVTYHSVDGVITHTCFNELQLSDNVCQATYPIGFHISHFCFTVFTVYFRYFMMSLMIMRTVLMVWLLYGGLWFYTNDFIPALCMLCMYMYVEPSLILHGLYTPRILHGLYTPRTMRFIYISWCISHDLIYVVFNCVFYCFINMLVFISNEEIKIFNQPV